MPPRVSVLKSGTLLRDDCGRILDARSSVTLIITGQQKILVDSGLEGEGEIITKRLAKGGLEIGDIDTLINTHSHADHTGNNRLFFATKILSPQEGDEIAPGVKIMQTPGHSMDSISVVVDSRMVHSGIVVSEKANSPVLSGQVIAIAGDALPTFGNYVKMVPPALNVNIELAISSMSKILRVADIVIPGHDHPFSVSKRTYIEDWE